MKHDESSEPLAAERWASVVRASRAPLTADVLASLAGGHAALSALAVTKASPSTNSDLIAALAVEPDEWPHMSALVADHQTAGRGRAGREWLTPKGAALTVSYVLRPRLPRERWGIVPLVVGLAAVNTMRSMGIDARLKWPNDVVVDCTGESGNESTSGTQGDIAGWGPLAQDRGHPVRGVGRCSGRGHRHQRVPDPSGASSAPCGIDGHGGFKATRQGTVA